MGGLRGKKADVPTRMDLTVTPTAKEHAFGKLRKDSRPRGHLVRDREVLAHRVDMVKVKPFGAFVVAANQALPA
jgi:hypothetical protein